MHINTSFSVWRTIHSFYLSKVLWVFKRLKYSRFVLVGLDAQIQLRRNSWNNLFIDLSKAFAGHTDPRSVNEWLISLKKTLNVRDQILTISLVIVWTIFTGTRCKAYLRKIQINLHGIPIYHEEHSEHWYPPYDPRYCTRNISTLRNFSRWSWFWARNTSSSWRCIPGLFRIRILGGVTKTP